jgi:hypothetical protein
VSSAIASSSRAHVSAALAARTASTGVTSSQSESLSYQSRRR